MAGVYIFELDTLSLEVLQEDHPHVGSEVHRANKLLIIALNQLKIINLMAIIGDVDDHRLSFDHFLAIL